MAHRIVMLTSQYLPEVFGGAEQQCQRLSNELASLGHEVTILTSSVDAALGGTRTEGALRVVRLAVADPPQMMGRRMWSSLQWARAVQRWMKEHRDEFDLIHCHQAKFNAWVGTRAAKDLNKPCLVKVGNAGDRMDLLRLSKKKFVYGSLLATSIKQNAERFVAISSDMAKDLASFGIPETKITYIPNGIRAPADFLDGTPYMKRSARTDLGLPQSTRIFIFAGRLGRQKNVATLIEGFGQAVQNVPEALLLVVGSGEEEAALKAQAARQIPEGQVRFLGRLEDIWPLYAAADCFVLPALAEGLSNALLEAQAAGLPVIATRVSGNVDFVAPDTSGYLFDPRDADTLAHHITTMLALSEEERKAMGAAGQGHILENASIDKVAKRYEALYAELLNPAS